MNETMNGYKQLREMTVPRWAGVLIDKLEEEHDAVKAERDALRQALTNLTEAAELGLEYAEERLSERQASLAGYPSKWALDQTYIEQIKAAIDAAKGGQR